MKRDSFHPDHETRRGVALIIVLGFLSIMIIMALAFLTNSRVERMVADVSMDANRGRQMARTAINAAMSDFSYQMYTEEKMMAPEEGTDLDLFLSSKDYASGEVQSPAETLKDSGSYVMKGEARNWIPRRYLAREDEVMQNTEWILVREDPSAGVGKDNPIVGRYAYVCFDMSGGLDGNLIALEDGVANSGNPTNRASIRNIGMKRLGEMDPIQDVAGIAAPPSQSNFKKLRRGWHGFDTLSELILLTNGRYNGGENSKAKTYNGTVYYYIEEGVSAEELPSSIMWNAPSSGSRWQGDRQEWANSPGLNPTNVSDLVPYSLASFRGWEYNPYTGVWDDSDLVAWDEHETWDSGKWSTVLSGMKDQFDGGSIPSWWGDVLDDYTENTTVPKDLDYPSPKNVPMINELGMTMKVDADTVNTRLDITISLEVETWFPFPSDENKRTDTFQINPEIGGGTTPFTAPPGVDIYIPMRGQANTFSVGSWTASPATPITFTPSYSDTPVVSGTLDYSVSVPITMTNTNQPFTSALALEIADASGEGIEITTGGDVADRVPAEALSVAGEFKSILTFGTDYSAYWEVTDPRLNWDAGAWQAGSGSMGDVNPLAIDNGYGSNGDSTTFYCRNGEMTSPVELGYLSVGDPWKTLEFCSKEGADTLAKMVSRDVITELFKVGVAYTNGTVNPNTSSSNVLSAVFGDLKFKDDGSKLSEEDLAELVGVFTNITAGKKIKDMSGATKFSGACMRGIDWIWADEFQPDGYYGTKWTKNERHRLIGMTWGLFNPNNSMFTVLVIGQSIKEGPSQPGKWSDDDTVTGERRAVALAWRDPTPPGNGNPHEMFIRVFKFMDE